MSIGSHRRWSLTGPAFDRLLQRLGPEPERAAREYDLVRKRLIGFFERRGAGPSEALADETIDRVARKLDEGQTIERLDGYFYGVASRVFQEWRKQWALERAAQREFPRPQPDPAPELSELRIVCLERCLRRLPSESRALVVAYYRAGAVERSQLAQTFGITYTNLRARACRLRVRLAGCLRECLEVRSRRS
jgi:DNA-directed RNA polymerase specialized sigma24 family protein